MRKNIGILFVFTLSVIALCLSKILSGYIKIEALTIGIILGMIFVNNFKVKEQYKFGVKFCQKKVLQWGIVLLGFKMSIEGIRVLGIKSVFLVIGYIITAICLALIFGKCFKTRPKTALLIGLGSSICGASAVVALSDSIKAEEEDTVLAVAVVSLLGAIGVLIYTFIFQLGNLSPQIYGTWSGLTLHGVAHAIAAAGAGGEVSKEIGTMVKLIRVFMLVPVSLVLSRVFKSENEKVHIPKYVLGFCITSAIGILNLIPLEIVKILLKTSDMCILMAMTALGLSVHFKTIKNQAGITIFMGSVLFLILSIGGLIVIKII